MDPPTHGGLVHWPRFLTVVVLIAATQPACGTWRTTRIEDDRGAATVGNTLRLRRGEERRTIRVVRVDYPLVEGVEDASKGPMAVVLDLTTFDEIEVYDYPRGVALSSLAVVGVLAGIAAVGAGAAYVICVQSNCLR
jgi:hypothetical protein